MFRHAVPLLAALTVACSSSTPGGNASGSASAAATSGALAVGSPAPALTLQLHDGRSLELSSLHGKYVLVYFYPKDDTKGCTIEANGIKDAWARFQAAGIEVFGVSTQDAASHQAFIDKYDLPFPLVVGGEAVARAFGVPLKNGLAERQSFLIGKDGKIVAVWPSVDPSEHAEAVLKAAS